MRTVHSGASEIAMHAKAFGWDVQAALTSELDPPTRNNGSLFDLTAAGCLVAINLQTSRNGGIFWLPSSHDSGWLSWEPLPLLLRKLISQVQLSILRQLVH